MERYLIVFFAGSFHRDLLKTALSPGFFVLLMTIFGANSALSQNDTLRNSSGDSLRFSHKKGQKLPPDSVTSLPSLSGVNKKGGNIPDSLVLAAPKDSIPEKRKFHIPTVEEIRILERKALEYSGRNLPPKISEIFMPLDSTGQKPSVTYKRALLIPGWGQAYNRSYWKIPVIYAGLGGAGYVTYFNHQQYKSFQLAYQYATDTDPNTNPVNVDSAYVDYPAEGLRSNREQYRTSRDQMILVMAGIYALQAVEAYVHSHLKHFDVSDDLSFQAFPYIQPAQPVLEGSKGNRSVSSGVCINLNF